MSEVFSEMEAENKYGNIKLLTVLTFIGSGLGVISSIVNYVHSAKNVQAMEEMVNKPEFEKMPDFVKKNV